MFYPGRTTHLVDGRAEQHPIGEEVRSRQDGLRHGRHVYLGSEHSDDEACMLVL